MIVGAILWVPKLILCQRRFYDAIDGKQIAYISDAYI